MHCNSLEMEAVSSHTEELRFLFPHLRNKAPSLTNNAPAVSRTAKQGRTYKAERSFASAHQFHRTRQLIPFTWKTISTRSDIIKAMFKLSNPAAQNPLGIVPGFDTPDATESVHSCPPLSHSHRILSFLQRNGIRNHSGVGSKENRKRTHPRWSCTIMMMPRIVEITITNGHKNFETRIQMYDRYKARENRSRQPSSGPLKRPQI